MKEPLVSRRVLDVLNEGLVRVQSWKYGSQLWTRGKVRTHTKACAGCSNKLLAGQESFKPITNALNRMHRLCVACAVEGGAK